MTAFTLTESIKQTIITRLAAINSAIALLDRVSGPSAQSTVEEALTIAERIESWAWRGLADDHAETPTPDTPEESPLPVPQTTQVPPPPAQTTDAPPKAGGASAKQLAAIFAIGKKKGHSAEDIKAWVFRRLNKKVDALTSREASHLIGDLEAL